ncbi:MAG: HEPN domain-containing protein [Candidatus Schekmanbacteria bacterium]|nr:HEPN domain-containing protein [Candidatus Schekmanbacteria bacterium]
MSSDNKFPIIYRLQQAQEALNDAQLLFDHNGTARAIINRCYYAIFYAVQALLEIKGLSTSKHSGAIALFDKEFVKTGKFKPIFSKDVHMAFEMRQEWDYKIIAKLDEINEQELLKTAQKFVARSEEYLRIQGYTI